MTDWVRLWHDMPTDPKWRTIARKSGQSIGNVIAVFTFMMCNASGNAAERGTLSGLCAEDVATALDVDESDVQAIFDAMQGRVVDADGKLTGWEKRQPKREDGTAAQRKAAWKERQRNAAERNGTHGNAPETETDTETDSDIANAISPAREKPDDAFDAFWQAYRKKEGKQAARKAWAAARKRGVTAEHIMQGLGRFQWSPDPKYIPQPATWLNKGRYDDEPMETRNGNGHMERHNGTGGGQRGATPLRGSRTMEFIRGVQRELEAERSHEGGDGGVSYSLALPGGG
jgi:hypothetical protein